MNEFSNRSGAGGRADPPIRRLGVIGDVHGEHRRLATVLDWLAGQQLDALVCTGDVADGRGCINRSCELLRDAGVQAVAGNHDRWLLQDRVRHVVAAHHRHELEPANLAYLQGLPPTRELDTVAGRLLLCHGIGDRDLEKVWPGTSRSAIRRSATLDRLLRQARHRFVINGHMHFRVLIDFEELLLMNAGTLKGERAGVTIMDFAGARISAFQLDAEGRPRPGVEHPLWPEGRRVWRDTAEFDGQWQPVVL